MYTHGKENTHKDHSCCSNGETGKEQKDGYICPMKCEGEKEYDSQGNCPVCNMKLVPMGSAGNENHHHHEHREHHNHDKTKPASAGTYYCPMHCEGDKTYDKPGDCPECNMKLVPMRKSKGKM